MQYKITQITSKTIQTKRGLSGLWEFYVEGRTEKITAWKNDENKDWYAGCTINGEIEQNGKYFNFKAGASSYTRPATGSIVATPSTAEVIHEIRQIVGKIYEKVSGEIKQEDDIPF